MVINHLSQNPEVFSKFNLLKEKLKIYEKSVLTANEISLIDENSKYFGLPKSKLMENSGTLIFEEIMKLDFKFSKAYVFCGTGNNGGDGFVITRHLSNILETSLVFIGDEKNIKSPESNENFKIVKDISFFGNLDYYNVLNSENVMEIMSLLEKDLKLGNILLVDAMLGTGSSGKLKNPYQMIVDFLNVLKSKYYEKLKILSVDIQTGNLNSDIEVILHKKKTNNNCKNFIIKSIGIPKYIEYTIGQGDLNQLSQKKIKKSSHKGQNGKVLVIGGSSEYHGAPVLSALSASKLSDIVSVASVSKVIKTIRNFPELIPYELLGDFINLNHLDNLLDYSKKFDCIVLGNGISLNDDTGDFINSYITGLNRKVVIDADAIKLIDYNSFEFKPNFIFTPHKREFEYMERYISTPDFKSTVVLKGSYDIIFDSENIKLNITGNPGMTKGGTGDILCGLIGAIYATNDAFLSACAGAYINGYCGDKLLESKGYFYNSIDIVDNLSYTLKELL
ncbi:carbohydrate kinase, YjeF related protein [Methanococcus vannielii SB]|uniref:ADP-dependent (S)-NAD(P)H-hydrate dehydratase n=1 Tax=Methanococcus vannielii (strain ATCC 35089 / DSM 1224 / JCM 13029 / OCM 148 / SB) TaxID=406327 RepID=A6URP2_METVS|nr:bifunctional ADP-dependent NAD(P)H-hydrate dehydratase/NAD(P)H-hydrate epimerase [Methanococcus vannielii]ABR55164.1 carbohydrate kinase, YjeF related protein [Methanococcus vannielii SB]